MDEFARMDAFFAVTTAAVIIITALSAGVLVYVLRFLHVVNKIAANVHEESEEIREDLHELRKGMSKGFRLVPLFSFFKKTTKRLNGAKRKTK